MIESSSHEIVSKPPKEDTTPLPQVGELPGGSDDSSLALTKSAQPSSGGLLDALKNGGTEKDVSDSHALASK